MALIIALLPIPVALLRLMPIHRVHAHVLAFYAPMVCIYILAYLVYLRDLLARFVVADLLHPLPTTSGTIGRAFATARARHRPYGARPRGCSSGPTRASTSMSAWGCPRTTAPSPCGWRAIVLGTPSRWSGTTYDTEVQQVNYRSDKAEGPAAGTATVDRSSSWPAWSPASPSPAK